MTILAIEDDPGIRETLGDLLSLHGHDVLLATDGPSGVALAERRPDLVLCDIGLPGMDGYDVIATLQRSSTTRDIPFIFLTAHAQREDQRKGMSLGADDYITKPFTAQELLAAIDARVRRQRPLRERIEQLAGERRRQATANWAHELLTPLNGILGGLELIELEADTIRPAELREFLGIIRGAAEEELRLARKIMRHHELESQIAIPAESRRKDRCVASDAIRAGVARAARSRANDLRLDLVPGEVALASDYLADAICELVENALRHTRAGDPVSVSAHITPQGDHLIEVSDSGPGLTADQINRIGPYVQFELARDRRGLGLGLAITRATATLAGGELILKSAEGPASAPGLRACLRLPRVA